MDNLLPTINHQSALGTLIAPGAVCAVRSIVLGEIAHHNLSGHFSPPWTDREALRSFESDPASLAQLPSCNAFSLAASTGLPRETIRRKIARLEALGWIVRTGGRELRITPEVAGHFAPDFNVRLMENLLATAERIREILALEKASGR